MSKRSEMRMKRQRRNQFQTIFLVVLAVAALGAVGFLVYQGVQSGSLGDYPGKSKGPADAKVVVQEFSDFQ